MTVETNQNKFAIQSQLTNLHGEQINFEKDMSIFNAGDTSDAFYLVINGTVELIHRLDTGNSFAKAVNKNEFFGLDDFIKKSKRTNQALAKEDSEIIKITLPVPEKDHFNSKTKSKSIFQERQVTTVTSLSNLQNLVNVNNINDVKVISFYGQRANLGNALFFKNILLELIEKGNHKLIVDLSACKIIDSTFLGSLIAVLKRISITGGRLCLICCADICSWLFVMTKMDKVFEIYQSIDEAVNSFNQLSG